MGNVDKHRSQIMVATSAKGKQGHSIMRGPAHPAPCLHYVWVRKLSAKHRLPQRAFFGSLLDLLAGLQKAVYHLQRGERQGWLQG